MRNGNNGLKKRILLFLIVVLAISFTGCGYVESLEGSLSSLSGDNGEYKVAILQLADGTIVKGELEDATRDSHTGLVKITINGYEYRVHGCNVSIIKANSDEIFDKYNITRNAD